jgi:hypothetical protein
MKTFYRSILLYRYVNWFKWFWISQPYTKIVLTHTFSTGIPCSQCTRWSIQALWTQFTVRRLVVSPCWGYGFVTQMWLSDDTKKKLCKSNVTFILDWSTTAWQVARWHRAETLISGLNPPGQSLSVLMWLSLWSLWHPWTVIYLSKHAVCIP